MSRCKKKRYTQHLRQVKRPDTRSFNSFLVMNSLDDSPVHTAAPFAQVIKIEYMYKCMH